ncbi:MAG: nucleotidyl transferase AbiEii/AbiGii toxin family protein [Patescibacteria group bacterium]
MITRGQIADFAKQFKTNESNVFREYLQVLFLSKLSQHTESKGILFKGGTAVHVIFGAPRFSEDLDFSVTLIDKDFSRVIGEVFDELQREERVEFKERKTVTGKRFLLHGLKGIMPFATFINLDFSFREKVIEPTKSLIDTPYPILITAYVNHLSAEEICAEKIRAILTRRKGRDIYDLWYLLSKGTTIRAELVTQKLKYYELGAYDVAKLIDRIETFGEKDFVMDLRPFISIGEREKLPEMFRYTQQYLKQKLAVGEAH